MKIEFDQTQDRLDFIEKLREIVVKPGSVFHVTQLDEEEGCERFEIIAAH